MLHIPDELIVFLCHFLRVNALARLRSTCGAMRKLLSCEEAWHNALFVPSGLWYQLKDVSLAAKYMNWSGRLPSPLPSAIDTMDNVAFWGTITDGERVIATVGQVYLHLRPILSVRLRIVMTRWRVIGQVLLMWHGQRTP